MTYNPTTPRSYGDKDAPHMSPITPAEDVRTVLINRVTWAAVFAGVAMSLVTQLLLNMLGVGIGAATLDPASGDNPAASSFSMGAAIWWTVSGIIAAFLGGHAAGRLSGRPKESTAGWHGLIAWAVTTLIVVGLITTALGRIAGGTLSMMGSAVSGVVQTAAPAAANVDDPFGTIERQIREGTGADPQAARDAAVAAVRAAVTGNEAQASEARERAAQALSQSQNISIDEARQRVGQYETQYRQQAQQAKEKAKQAADVAAGATSTGAIAAFIALLLGAIAAWFGGRSGAIDPTMTDAEIIPARRG